MFCYVAGNGKQDAYNGSSISHAGERIDDQVTLLFDSISAQISEDNSKRDGLKKITVNQIGIRAVAHQNSRRIATGNRRHPTCAAPQKINRGWADRWRWGLLEKVVGYCRYAGKFERYIFNRSNRAGATMLEYGRFLTPLHRGQRHQDAHHDAGQLDSINRTPAGRSTPGAAASRPAAGLVALFEIARLTVTRHFLRLGDLLRSH